MKSSARSATLLLLALLAAASIWYAFSPDGFVGYDEGTRLTAFTARAGDKLRHSDESSATVFYTPKYGNDQAISAEFTKGSSCADGACYSSTVVVSVKKGKSGAGYALGRSISVARSFSIHKTQGPIRIDLNKQGGVVQLVGVQ